MKCEKCGEEFERLNKKGKAKYCIDCRVDVMIENNKSYWKKRRQREKNIQIIMRV